MLHGFMSLAVTQTSLNKAMLSQDIPAPVLVYSLLLLEHLLLHSLLDFFSSKMTFFLFSVKAKQQPTSLVLEHNILNVNVKE